MKRIKRMLLLMVQLLLAPLSIWAVGENTIPNDPNNPFDMLKGELHGSRASFGSDNHIDWMNNGDYAIYQLVNTIDAQYYDIDFGVYNLSVVKTLVGVVT